MNRRTFLTAIPAAVAALTASKSLTGATTPVNASEDEIDELVAALEGVIGAVGDYGDSITASIDAMTDWLDSLVPFIAGETHVEIAHFAHGRNAVLASEWTVPPHTYVAPANATVWNVEREV